MRVNYETSAQLINMRWRANDLNESKGESKRIESKCIATKANINITVSNL